jgi:hypothetical protein
VCSWGTVLTIRATSALILPLDVFTSREIGVSDETVFSFAELHPNAGNLLQPEILFLPPTLRNSCGSMNLDAAKVSNIANSDLPVCAAADVTDSNRAGVPGTAADLPGAHAGVDSQPHAVVDAHACGPSTIDSHDGPRLAVHAFLEVPSSAHDDVGPSTHATVDGHARSPPVVDAHAEGTDPGCPPTVPMSSDGEVISAAASDSAAPLEPHTRLQNNIRKPKIYTDGTIRYACLIHSGEPESG